MKNLAPMELKLLLELARRSPCTVPYDELAKNVIGFSDDSAEASIRVGIATLRKKLGDLGKQAIVTEYGFGYRALKSVPLT